MPFAAFQRTSRGAFLLLQRWQEGRHFGAWQGGMVLDLAHLGTRRQQLVEVPAPARRVFAGAIATSAATHKYARVERFRSEWAPKLLVCDAT